MKPRHWTTLIVLLIASATVAGIFLRLRADPEPTELTLENILAGDIPDSLIQGVQRTAAAERALSIWLPVEGAAVRQDTFVIWVSATGRAAPLRRAAVRSEVSGPVMEVPVREGGYVAEGQLLARVDPVIYEIKVKRAQAALDRAQADFVDRVLFDDQLPDSIRVARAAQARIRVGLTGQEASLAEAEYELAKTEVVAPFAGRVANLTMHPGARINVGDSIATIVDLAEIEIDAEVLHSEIPAIEVGRAATAIFPALPGQLFSGRVVSVNPLISPETQTARVTVRLSNPEARIIPGMPGSVRIAGRQLAGRTFIPKTAVVERRGRQVVFTFEPSEPGAATGRSQWKYVTPGLENEDYVEVVPGDENNTFMPERGEIVLVVGHATLTHDAPVRIMNYDDLKAGAAEQGPDGLQ